MDIKKGRWSPWILNFDIVNILVENVFLFISKLLKLAPLGWKSIGPCWEKSFQHPCSSLICDE